MVDNLWGLSIRFIFAALSILGFTSEAEGGEDSNRIKNGD